MAKRKLKFGSPAWRAKYMKKGKGGRPRGGKGKRRAPRAARAPVAASQLTAALVSIAEGKQPEGLPTPTQKRENSSGFGALPSKSPLVRRAFARVGVRRFL